MLIDADLDTSIKTEEVLSSLRSDVRNEASEFIAHHGIKGQKWGVRRYQNSDGSLTEEGKVRYGDAKQSRIRRNLTKGQARFAKDAILSLEQTPYSKDPNEFKKTLKELGKAAEESGAMNPNDRLSPYDLSRSPDQTELFDMIYSNMPTVVKNRSKTRVADKEMHHSETELDEFIAHHGIKGQKWGVRRYQNHDGSLTPEGRKRYGVGPALTSLGKKAAGAAGKAIRKATGRQTDAELSEELAKARHKYDRQNAKDEINRLNGKRKKLSKMSDAEVDDYIDRLIKERNVRNMENELKRMNRNAVSNFVRDLGSGVMSNVAAGVGEGVKRGLSSAIATNMAEREARKQAIKWDKHNEKYNPDKLAADKNKNLLDATRSDLELRALKGDKQAARILNSVAKASRGNSEKDGRVSDSKDAVEIARNELELRAIKGDKDALKILRKVTDAKKGSKKGGQQQTQSNQSNQSTTNGKKSSKNGGQQQTQSKPNADQTTQTSSKQKMRTQADYEAAKKRAKDNIKAQASTPVSDARTYSVSNDAIDWMAELSSRKGLPPAKS